MRVRASEETPFRPAANNRPRSLRPVEATANAIPGADGRSGDARGGVGGPVEATTNARLDPSDGRTGQAQRAGRPMEAEGETERPNASPGFTQPAEGGTPSRSMDRLQISDDARKKSVAESVREEHAAIRSAMTTGTQSPTATATIASTLDLRV